jgi:hypothetical protein
MDLILLFPESPRRKSSVASTLPCLPISANMIRVGSFYCVSMVRKWIT